MKINIFRLLAVLIAGFVLGGLAYKQYADWHNSATVFIVPAGDAAKWLAGDWTIDDLAGATHSTQIDKAAAVALVGKMAEVRGHEFAFDDMSCPTEFSKSIEQPISFFQDYGSTPFTMHLHMPSTRIDAGCADVYPVAHATLLIAYEGYFLEAIRKQQETQPSTTQTTKKVHSQ